jgi:hypothetical protein
MRYVLDSPALLNIVRTLGSEPSHALRAVIH